MDEFITNERYFGFKQSDQIVPTSTNTFRKEEPNERLKPSIFPDYSHPEQPKTTDKPLYTVPNATLARSEGQTRTNTDIDKEPSLAMDLTISEHEYRSRRDELVSRADEDGYSGIVLFDALSIQYVTGLYHQPTERPVAVGISDDATYVIVPRLEGVAVLNRHRAR